MNAATRRELMVGPTGAVELAIDEPAATPKGLAVIAHPHPLFGGTLDNKVVQTMARACVQWGLMAVRFNFRGIGASTGTWDEGRGEIDDALAVVAYARAHLVPAQTPLLLAGFSFGGYVASQCFARLAATAAPAHRLALVSPAVVNFPVPAAPEGALVVQGEADDVVPLSAVLSWAAAQQSTAPTPVTVIPGAGHFFHGQLPTLKRLFTQWLAATEPSTPD